MRFSEIPKKNVSTYFVRVNPNKTETVLILDSKGIVRFAKGTAPVSDEAKPTEDTEIQLISFSAE